MLFTTAGLLSWQPRNVTGRNTVTGVSFRSLLESSREIGGHRKVTTQADELTGLWFIQHWKLLCLYSVGTVANKQIFSEVHHSKSDNYTLYNTVFVALDTIKGILVRV